MKDIKLKATLFQYIIKIAREILDPETNEFAYFKTNPAGDKIWYRTQHDLTNQINHYRIDRATGKKEWYKGGRLHRENDLPAVEHANGDKEWRQEGRLHREFGPAKTFSNGNAEYWYAGKKMPELETMEIPLVVGRNEDGSLKREEIDVAIDWTGTIAHSADNDMSPIWVFDPETLDLIRQPKLREVLGNDAIVIGKLKDIESGNI